MDRNSVCESCRADYPKVYLKEVVPQGKMFCFNCYGRWEQDNGIKIK